VLQFTFQLLITEATLKELCHFMYTSKRK